MSISSVVTADYSGVITTIRGHLSKGTQLSTDEMRLALAVVKDAITRMDVATEVAALRVTYDAQMVILQALVDGTAAAAVDVADAALEADLAAVEAALPTVPTYTSSVGADG